MWMFLVDFLFISSRERGLLMLLFASYPSNQHYCALESRAAATWPWQLLERVVKSVAEDTKLVYSSQSAGEQVAQNALYF